MEPLKVFLSSTCYDLKQIRSDLFDFFHEMGFSPIMSEYSNFPVNPDKNTVENCIENVKNNTDVFILIIGNRYGSLVGDDKSITNTEYLFSRTLGIPSYVFIDKQILSILPIWEKNKNGDFSNVVDSPKIFEFVNQIRETEKKWCFNFEKAQDIISTLRIQFSHLFKEALSLQRKFITNLPDFYNKLSPTAINLILNKSDQYEMLFFAQCLEDELHKHDNLKTDLDYQLKFGSKEKIDGISDLQRWLELNISSLNTYAETAEKLIIDAFSKFYGEPGVTSDLKGLYYVACGLTRLFQELILWHNSILATVVPNDFINLRNNFAEYTVRSALKIWEFPNLIRSELKRGQELAIQHPEEPINLKIILTLEIDPDAHREFLDEMQRITDNM